MPLSKEDLQERFRLGREKAAQLRAEGLLPPRHRRTKAEMAAAAAASNSTDSEASTQSNPHLAHYARLVADQRDEIERLKNMSDGDTASPPISGSIADSAEFKAAVAAAVEAATAGILERLAAKNGNGSTFSGDELSFARVLAAQIAELADQDRRVKRVPAHEMEERRAARERMENLIVDAYTRGEEPEYEVMRAIYVDEQLVDPTWVDANHVLRRTRIAYTQVPNEALRPASPLAQRIFDEFIASIGGMTTPINRPDLGRKSVRVLHREGLDDGPAVGTGTPAGALRILGRDDQPGKITLTNVLGTIAAPAKQLA